MYIFNQTLKIFKCNIPLFHIVAKTKTYNTSSEFVMTNPMSHLKFLQHWRIARMMHRFVCLFRRKIAPKICIISVHELGIKCFCLMNTNFEICAKIVLIAEYKYNLFGIYVHNLCRLCAKFLKRKVLGTKNKFPYLLNNK